MYSTRASQEDFVGKHVLFLGGLRKNASDSQQLAALIEKKTGISNLLLFVEHCKNFARVYCSEEIVKDKILALGKDEDFDVKAMELPVGPVQCLDIFSRALLHSAYIRTHIPSATYEDALVQITEVPQKGKSPNVLPHTGGAKWEFVVRNIGTAPVAIEKPMVYPREEFEISFQEKKKQLPPGGTIKLTLNFHPNKETRYGFRRVAFGIVTGARTNAFVVKRFKIIDPFVAAEAEILLGFFLFWFLRPKRKRPNLTFGRPSH